jgi:hypothetical protein
MGQLTPRKEAELEAERTYEAFLVWAKRVTLGAIFFLLVVVVGCNSGVEEGPRKTGSGYNGGQYSPTNLKI